MSSRKGVQRPSGSVSSDASSKGKAVANITDNGVSQLSQGLSQMSMQSASAQDDVWEVPGRKNKNKVVSSAPKQLAPQPSNAKAWGNPDTAQKLGMHASMDLDKIFHMKSGQEDTSYSNNSSLQKRAADSVKHISSSTLVQMFLATRPESLAMADLGCSSGPNTLSSIKQLVGAVVEASESISQPPPEFRVYLNDLHYNDFNTIFQALPELLRELREGKNDGGPTVYIAAYPGTFYGRLFPNECLNFVYSFNSLHWLSKVPPGIYDEKGSSVNKNSIYLSERSPPMVSQSYYRQFQEDFSVFLKSRSDELIRGGRMVLMLLGRTETDSAARGSSFYWEILYQSLAILVAQGEVEEEKLESYDVHFYAPSKQELEEEVRKEGSFSIELAQMYEVEKDVGSCSAPSYGVAVAKAVRSIQESMIAHHFGEAILDKLFDHYGRLVDQELNKVDVQTATVVLVLTKL